MNNPLPIVEAALKACAANVGPLIGIELELGKISSEATSSTPEGDLLVLPITASVGDETHGTLTLSAPTGELATLGRRLLGDDDPEKDSEASPDNLDACREVLNLMGRAVDEVFREQLNEDIRLKPRTCWLTSDAQGESFLEGEHIVALTTVSVPGGSAVGLTLRFPQNLLDEATDSKARIIRGNVLLAGLSEELESELTPILKAARIQVEITDPDSREANAKYEQADVIFFSCDRSKYLELLRSFRTSNSTWRIPSILCLKEPTRDSVIEAVECGASHILKIPTSQIDLLRILRDGEN